MTDAPRGAPWLLLIHQLPAKPAYLRVKIWRRLQALGAVAVKNAVYTLPNGPEAQEDLEWLLREIIEGGGEGFVCEARLIDGLDDRQVRALFDQARAADYATLADEARGLAHEVRAAADPRTRLDAKAQLARLKARRDQAAAIDFFGAPGRESVEGLLAALELELAEAAPEPEASSAPESWRGRVWVTREGMHVDRMATAWLVRRFLDPDARFKFVPAKGYRPERGELRFDMFEAELTHEGDRCTFEVLRDRAGLDDPALQVIGEIVHDIDLKDGKFARTETAGIAALIAGICALTSDDEERLRRGDAVFDELYHHFTGRHRSVRSAHGP